MNSKPKAPATIHKWLAAAKTTLRTADVPTASLDAELLLAHALDVSRTWLHAHGEDSLPTAVAHTADALLDERVRRIPVAYLIGSKEFYGRDFAVTHDVLIPRPESEMMIELLKEILSKGSPWNDLILLVDIGTGSGCLGITAKLELPRLDVTLADISSGALTVARDNAETLHAAVHFSESNLLSNLQPLTTSYHFILANLPYVDREWKTPPELNHEPALALFADEHGLQLINELLDQTPHRLEKNGYILLEADPEQHASIIARGQQNGLVLETVRDYIVVLQKQ